MKEKFTKDSDLFTFLFIMFFFGILIAFSQNSVNHSLETIRTVNIVGLWSQAFGVILISYEFLTGPLAKKGLERRVSIERKMSDDFYERILKINDNKEKVREAFEHQLKKSNLDKEHLSINDYKITVRKVYAFGLYSVIFGYVLQLSIL